MTVPLAPRTIAIAVTTALLLSLATAAVLISPANAANVGQTTRFEIDGNKSGTYDWDDLASPAAGTNTYSPYAIGSSSSTGVQYYKRDLDNGSINNGGVATHAECGASNDDIGASTISQQDGPVWATTTGSAKPDLYSISTASEKVTVPTTNGGSRIDDILYVAYESCESINGSYNVNLTLDDGDGLSPVSLTGGPTDTNGGDVLFVFQFQAGQPGTYMVMNYFVATSPQPVTGCTGWCDVTAGIPANTVDALAGLVDGKSFAEVAINVTALGVKGSTTGCSSIAVGEQSSSLAGFSIKSTLKDVVAVSPFSLSNCGSVQVTKQADPTLTDPTTSFDFSLTQVDGGIVHDGQLSPPDTDNNPAAVTSALSLGESKVWSNVIAQSDYVVAETSTAPGWREQQVACDFVDIFTANPDTGETPWWRTDVVISQLGVATGDFATIPPSSYLGKSISTWVPASANLPSGVGASCRIINESRTLSIIKQGTPSSTPDTFSFTASGIAGDPTAFTLAAADDPATDSEVENVANFAMTSPDGTLVSITETATASWKLDAISCVVIQTTNGNTTSTPIVNGENGVSIDLASGTISGLDVPWRSRVECTYANSQDPAQLTIIKNVPGTPGLAGTSFDFTATPQIGDGLPPVVVQPTDPPSSTLTGSTTQTIAAGTYTITESAKTGYAISDLTCVPGTAGWSGSPSWSRPSATAATITLLPGEHAVCTYTNTPSPGALVIQTTTVGGVGSFDYTAAPADSSPSTTTSISTTAADVMTPSATMDMTPGMSYSLTQGTDAEWVTSTFSCDSSLRGEAFVSGSEPTLDVLPGEEITCTLTNTLRPHVIVTKTTVSPNTAPDFPFTFGPDPANPSASFTLTDGESWDSGPLDPGVPVTLAEGTTASWAVVKFECNSSNPATPSLTLPSFDGATQTFTPKAGETVTCSVHNAERGAVAVSKSIDDAGLIDNGDGSYTANYDINVTSLSMIAETYDLSDVPLFAAGTTIDSITWTGPNNPDPTPLAADGYLVKNATVPAEGLVAYRVTVVLTPGADTPLGDRACGGLGTGTYNEASITVTTSGTATDSNADCYDLPEPAIAFNKTTVDGPVLVSTDPVTGAGVYRVSYQIDVANSGDGSATYAINESPTMPTGAALTELSATTDAGQVSPTFGVADRVLAQSVSLAPNTTHSYTVTMTVSVVPSMSAQFRQCTGDPGRGVFNEAALTINGVGQATAAACTGIPLSAVTVAKRVAEAGELSSSADGWWHVSYDVTVTNEAGAGPGRYDVSDALDLPADATGTATVTTSPDAALEHLTSGFDGVTETSIATGVPLAANADNPQVHSYRVAVAFQFGSLADVTASCASSAGGVANSATITVEGIGLSTPRVCTSFATLRMTKEVTNDNGGEQSPSDVALTAVGPSTFGGRVSVIAPVAPGDYTLTESPMKGYTPSSWTCTGGDVTSDVVTIAGAASVDCRITNNDNPVDMSITKSKPSGPVIAGGPSFSYDLAVWNAGSRDVDSDEPVTVVDSLPVGMEFVGPPPPGCTISGRTMTCVLDASLFAVDAEPVILTVTVRVLADAPITLLTQPAYVTTEDDPVCVGDNCLPPSCDRDESVDNLACLVVQVQRPDLADLQLTKTVSKTAAAPGQTLNWTLIVLNKGPGLARDITLNDKVPTVVTVISVKSDSAVMTCTRAANDVTCAASSIEPGDTITVTIAATIPDPITDDDGTADGQITVRNTATLTSATSDPQSANNDAVVETTVGIPWLPQTGADILRMSALAGALIAIGASSLWWIRRRRELL